MSARAVILAGFAGLAFAGDARAADDVASYPEPGSRYASAFTTVTFAGAGVGALDGLEVVGSESGAHPGKLRKLRDGRGTVFEPETPFKPGERVLVRSGVRVLGGGRSFSFRTARFAAPHQRRAAASRARAADAPPCRLKKHRYRTLRGFRPPDLCTSVARGSRLSPGRLMVTPRPGPNGQWGAAIVSSGGKLLWYLPAATTINDLKVVSFRGERLLALFHKPSERTSYYELLNRRYQPVARITAGNGYRVDSHELQLTTHGTIYLGSYSRVLVDRREVVDYVVQELDGATGDVLFEWHALDHVPLSASYKSSWFRVDNGWDYFHGNSIEPPQGTREILVSARNTSSVYAIDRATGDVRWTLSGKRDDYGIVERHPRWQLCAQHDARRLPNGDITLFDNGSTFFRNGSGTCPDHPSRAMVFRLDEERRRARVIRTFSSREATGDSRGYWPYAVGSVRTQPDGNLLISWGTTGRVTEVTPEGDVNLRLAIGERSNGGWSYRAVRDEWDGTPDGRPAIEARRRRDGRIDVWASWNGATSIARWRVLAGDAEDALDPAGEFGFTDLETGMRFRSTADFVAVQALDAHGNVLGQSATARAR